MSKARAYSKVTQEAAKLLGRQIKIGRKRRGWSENQLAERAGIARATVQKIERGDLGCAMGLVFEAAVLVGVKLFDTELSSLKTHKKHADEILALLPKHTHAPKRVVNDAF
jgi:transcriptional regulator with XRE-family HTH domain